MDLTPNGNELGRLLRSRRERLRPSDVGLPDAGRRRTPGLRREEVARLASISPTYYTFLEQGRARRPSPDVVDALASALRLDDIERVHLRDLAYTGPTGSHSDEDLDEAVHHLVERLNPHPTYVKGASWDILAANAAARRLYRGWDADDERAPNMLRWMFLHPFARELFVDWDGEARAMLARYRAALAAHPGDEGADSLRDDVLAGSREASDWWTEPSVARIGSGHKRLQVDGRVVTFEHAVLHVAGNPEQHLVTFSEPLDG